MKTLSHLEDAEYGWSLKKLRTFYKLKQKPESSMRICLSCKKEYLSEGPFNRVCVSCRGGK
jgi:hypothetical protein